uniref:Integrase catalytic domain-containing protein n=1 Tax=Tanacetum cinerariifolium TaxID=118510 RepID=A0A699GQI0_TANCI|nr:hypothetical protein [Tanacetum cinerariifolium]
MTTPITTSTTDSQMHINIMVAGLRDHPSMLATGRYAQWQSRFLRYIDTRPNGDALRKCILEAVDACKTSHDMWIVIERLQQGESLNIQDVKTNLFSEFGKFTSHDEESMDIKRKVRTKRIAKNANPLVLVDADQHYPDPYSQAPKSHKSYKQSSSTRSNASTICKGKEIAKSITPPSEKPKRVKDSTYHNEKMLLCKQAKKGVSLQVEQSDWLADTDEEIDEQELEAHYSYMAKIHDNKCLVEKDDSNVIPDSPDMCDNDIQIDQNVEDKRDALANLIANLNLDVDENKKIQKILKPSVLGKPTPFSDFLKRKSFSKTKSVPKTNVSEGLSKPVTTQILPQTADKAERNINVINPEMYQIDTRTSQSTTTQLPQTFRNTNPRVSTSIGVIHRTNVSRLQLKSTQMKDKVVQNNSQVKFKKIEVEDHHRISSISNKTKYVTACNDSLKSKTSNVNVVCATYGKCLVDLDHYDCVSKFLNDVNARTKKPNVVPISTRKPKCQANKSIATPLKKIVVSESTIQKSKSYYRILYEKTRIWFKKIKRSTGFITSKDSITISSQLVNFVKRIWRLLFGNLRVIHRTNVSTPQLKSTQKKDKVVPNNSQIVHLILFIADAGCTKHMIGNLKLLCNFLEKYLGTVRFGSDLFSPILGYGDLVQGNITINRVYYVEGLHHNLFSVGLFCDADLEVAFWKSTNDFINSSFLMATALPTQAWLWHRRLSHLNFDYINLLSKKDVMIGLSKLKYVKDQICSSCEVSKAKRNLFKTKVVPSLKGRLNLLHMDLCGPMWVASIDGKKYILVIVDDYSKYTWTLFLRSKDETPEVLKDFLTMIQQNLQTLVIFVRTDKGTKFLNKILHAFFKEEGIEHQTSTLEHLNRMALSKDKTILSLRLLV